MKCLLIIQIFLFSTLVYSQEGQKKIELYEGLINQFELVSKTNYVCINDFYYNLKPLGFGAIVLYPDSLQQDESFRDSLIRNIRTNYSDSIYFADLVNSYYIGLEARNYNVINLGADYSFYYVYPLIETNNLQNYLYNEKSCDFFTIIPVYYYNQTNLRLTSRTMYYQITRKENDKEFRYKEIKACSNCSDY